MSTIADSKGVTYAIVGIGAGLLLLGGYFWWKHGDTEPKHEGRDVHQWIKDVRVGDEKTVRKASEALKAIGAPALPAIRETIAEEMKKPPPPAGGSNARDSTLLLKLQAVVKQIEPPAKAE